MRLQPSWILESLPNPDIESVFVPLGARPESLLVFKQLGIKMYANDPVESRAMCLRALLENPGEPLAVDIRRKFNRVLPKPLEFEVNPFRTWENKPFSRLQLDYLFYWREATLEITEPRQRDLFWAAVRGVFAHWLSQPAEVTSALPPDEVIGYLFERQKELVLPGEAEVFALHTPLDELGDEVEADLYLVPLMISDRDRPGAELETFFHAWFRGNGDLTAARTEIDAARRGWTIRWDDRNDVRAIAGKVGRATQVAVCWSAQDLPPRVHEESIANPIREAFASRFANAQLLMKTADLERDDYDGMLIFHR
jgi:hypothetical protein